MVQITEQPSDANGTHQMTNQEVKAAIETAFENLKAKMDEEILRLHMKIRRHGRHHGDRLGAIEKKLGMETPKGLEGETYR